MVGAPAKNKLHSHTKAASIPARRQNAQGFLDLFFDAAPSLEYFSNFASSALRRHLLKRHLTLWLTVRTEMITI